LLIDSLVSNQGPARSSLFKLKPYTNLLLRLASARRRGCQASKGAPSGVITPSVLIVLLLGAAQLTAVGGVCNKLELAERDRLLEGMVMGGGLLRLSTTTGVRTGECSRRYIPGGGTIDGIVGEHMKAGRLAGNDILSFGLLVGAVFLVWYCQLPSKCDTSEGEAPDTLTHCVLSSKSAEA
jgi:hypothetical protein